MVSVIKMIVFCVIWKYCHNLVTYLWYYCAAKRCIFGNNLYLSFRNYLEALAETCLPMDETWQWDESVPQNAVSSSIAVSSDIKLSLSSPAEKGPANTSFWYSRSDLRQRRGWSRKWERWERLFQTIFWKRSISGVMGPRSTSTRPFRMWLARSTTIMPGEDF